MLGMVRLLCLLCLLGILQIPYYPEIYRGSGYPDFLAAQARRGDAYGAAAGGGRGKRRFM
jgi:hypothetical protein